MFQNENLLILFLKHILGSFVHLYVPVWPDQCSFITWFWNEFCVRCDVTNDSNFSSLNESDYNLVALILPFTSIFLQFLLYMKWNINLIFHRFFRHPLRFYTELRMLQSHKFSCRHISCVPFHLSVIWFSYGNVLHISSVAIRSWDSENFNH